MTTDLDLAANFENYFKKYNLSEIIKKINKENLVKMRMNRGKRRNNKRHKKINILLTPF